MTNTPTKCQPAARQRFIGAAGTEPMKPVDLTFCVDVEFLESSIALRFIGDAISYKKHTDTQVRKFFEGRTNDSKEVVTLEALDKIVKDELRTNMKNNDAKARMQDVFANYHTSCAAMD